jgi:protease-4
MKATQESIITSALRSFFMALFAIIGLLAGTVPILIVVGALFGQNPSDLPLNNQVVILPNPSGETILQPTDAPVILHIDIEGPIGTELLSRHTVREQLRESRYGDLSNDRVKGVFLYINSPGGTVNDSDAIYRAVKEYKALYQVPVYAYVDGICASGGVYIAASADKIFASDVSIIGSIGVIFEFMNFSETLSKIGVKSYTLTEGKGKDSMNPMRPWADGEEKNFKDLITFYYDRFLTIVTANRPDIDREGLIKDMGAQVFSAPEAKMKGLIDESGYEMGEALQALMDATGIEGPFQVVMLQKRLWLNDLFKARSPLLTGKLQHEIKTSSFDKLEGNLPFYYLYRAG